MQPLEFSLGQRLDLGRLRGGHRLGRGEVRQIHREVDGRQHRLQGGDQRVRLEPDRGVDAEVDVGVGVRREHGPGPGDPHLTREAPGGGQQEVEGIGLDPDRKPLAERPGEPVRVQEVRRRRSAALHRAAEEEHLGYLRTEPQGWPSLVRHHPWAGEHGIFGQGQRVVGHPARGRVPTDGERLHFGRVDVVAEREEVVPIGEVGVQGGGAVVVGVHLVRGAAHGIWAR